MKNTKSKLTLSQETLSILTREKANALPGNFVTTLPICPTCTPVSFLGARQ